MKTYNVNRFGDWGYIHSARINGEWVELARRDAPPPFATVEASTLTEALDIARRCFADPTLYVSEQGGILRPTEASR